MYHIFDNVTYIYTIAFIAELCALGFYLASQRSNKALALLIGPLIALAGYALDYAVETDREQIENTTLKIIAASVAPDTAAMLGTLDNNINVSGLNLDQVTNIILKYFRNKKPFSSNYVKSIEVTSTEPENASAEFTAITVFNPEGEFASGGMVTSKWRFNFIKNPQQRFKITNMTMLSLNNSSPVNVFKDNF